jgi:hypothetical protein
MALLTEEEKKKQLGQDPLTGADGSVVPVQANSNSRYPLYSPDTPSGQAINRQPGGALAEGIGTALAGKAAGAMADVATTAFGFGPAKSALNFVQENSSEAKQMVADQKDRDLTSRIQNSQGISTNQSPQAIAANQGANDNELIREGNRANKTPSSIPSMSQPTQQLGQPSPEAEQKPVQQGQGLKGFDMPSFQPLPPAEHIPGPQGAPARAGTSFMYQQPSAPEYLTKEEAKKQGIGGWKSRQTVNNQLGADYRSQVDALEKETQNKTQASIANAANSARNAQQNMQSLEQGADQPQMKNPLSTRPGGQQQESPSDAQIRGLRDKIINAKTPEERKQAEDTYNAVMGRRQNQKPQIIEYPVGEPNISGERSKAPAVLNPDGKTYTPLTQAGGQQKEPTQAPQSALDYLKKNPDTAEIFKKKYGYLP